MVYEIETKLAWIFEELGCGDSNTFTKDTRILDVGMDSLDMVKFLDFIEDEFKITLEDDAFEDWNTIGDVMAYIQQKREEARDGTTRD